MARLTTRIYTPLAAVLLLGACSHAPAPAPAPAPIALRDANGNPIPPRPHVFGRHAWDLQYGDAVRRAEAQAQTGAPPPPAPAAPPAPPPVVALAPPPPPAPVVQAPPSPAAPAVVATPPQPAPAVQAPPPSAPASEPVPAPPTPNRGLLAILKDLRKPAPPPIAGGYQTATDMKAVRAAAEFAVHVSPLYELKGIYSAKTQVVAGTNYSLCLWVRQKEHEANPLHRRMVAATVFQGLDGHYELTSWQEVNVCHAGS
jgi:hypothetical protein